MFPFLVKLEDVLDKRLVRTFLSTIQLILTFGDRVPGLLLWEMGGMLLDAAEKEGKDLRRKESFLLNGGTLPKMRNTY